MVFGDLLGGGERVFAASAGQHQDEVMGWYLRRISEFVAENRTVGVGIITRSPCCVENA